MPAVTRKSPDPLALSTPSRHRKERLRGGSPPSGVPRAAEFFAGIGLVRQALEQAGCRVVWANDINPAKRSLYAANFPADHFLLEDIRSVTGSHIPDIEIATASFPCTDLSLAGARRGLQGVHSSMFWEFARVLDEMGGGRPPVAMLENVPSLATSHGGQDLAAVVGRMNQLGYVCDLLVLDARRFVPQSRPRLFVIGAQHPGAGEGSWTPADLRPAWVGRFAAEHPDLRLRFPALPSPPSGSLSLADVVERLTADDARWWMGERFDRFVGSLSPLQRRRLDLLSEGTILRWATAYRRTRAGGPVWEVRADALSGCLRTAHGGSSRQALVEAGHGEVRVRWMTAREYARLQGAPDFRIAPGIGENQALIGFGDAVCVPVVEWLAVNCLRPLALGVSAERSGEPAAPDG
ncbi:MAG: DNA cytosine methyltransferase [Chloroflexi bacterium]|nr:DNA cytosine methyltransferase [Chloroflexota bacterium]